VRNGIINARGDAITVDSRRAQSDVFVKTDAKRPD
jgi:hypothetical protein